MKETYKIFSKLLKENKVSPYEVSRATGISQATLSGWKSGRSQPKIDKLQKIAKYFDIPVTDFFEE